MKILFSGISKLYGTSNQVKFGSQMGEVNSMENASILVESGRVLAVSENDISDQADKVIDLKGAEVMPGFVDSHTHTVFAVPREEEFVMRLKGASYEEIAAAGGGILNSAQKLRRTSEDELFDSASVRIRNMIAQGTTTLRGKERLRFECGCRDKNVKGY
jgi:imidazolonepropionase